MAFAESGLLMLRGRHVSESESRTEAARQPDSGQPQRRRPIWFPAALGLLIAGTTGVLFWQVKQRHAAVIELTERFETSLEARYSPYEYTKPVVHAGGLSLVIGGGQHIHGLTVQGNPSRIQGWLELVCGKGSLANVVEIHIFSPDFGDNDIIHVLEFESVAVLSLDATQVTDAGVSRLRSLSQLQVLDLTRCRITGACLKSLDGLSLRELHVGGTEISNERLAEFRRRHPECEVFVD